MGFCGAKKPTDFPLQAKNPERPTPGRMTENRDEAWR
jgi:hypothetical protein